MKLGCEVVPVIGLFLIYRVTLLIALGMLAILFLMVADLGMPGLQQRVFIFLFLLWLDRGSQVRSTNCLTSRIYSAAEIQQKLILCWACALSHA